jgi:hypothetical protein
MKLIYVAHPFGGIASNLDAAELWVAELSRAFPHIFWAPWIPLCRHWVDSGDARKRGLEIDLAAVRQSDSIVLCGTGTPTPGMLVEIEAAKAARKYVHNLMGLSVDVVTSGTISGSIWHELEEQRMWIP